MFGPWRYGDDEHPLGWDPQFQRVHALRNKAPTNDNKKRSVLSVVFLASQALPLFPCFAVDGRLRTTGFHREDGENWFVWPIWQEPITLDTLRSLLVQRVNDLRKRSKTIFRCRRVRSGSSEKSQYYIFSNAEEYS